MPNSGYHSASALNTYIYILLCLHSHSFLKTILKRIYLFCSIFLLRDRDDRKVELSRFFRIQSIVFFTTLEILAYIPTLFSERFDRVSAILSVSLPRGVEITLFKVKSVRHRHYRILPNLRNFINISSGNLFAG